MDILLACKSVLHVCTMPEEARRGRQIPLELELKMVVSFPTSVLGNKLWATKSSNRS